jgi:pimeloyl-ACP methyl ester carboxylesterase
MTRRGLLALCIGVLVSFAGVQKPATEIADQYFDSNGVTIRYVDVGQGEPIVLIHAFGATLDLNWRRPGVVAALSNDFRVVALDCRGHGQSDKPHDAASYGAHMAGDVVNLLDHLKIGRAHLVGYSMGGDIVAQFVSLYPDRASTATIGGTSVAKSWTEEHARENEEIAASLEQGGGMRPLIQRLMPPDEPPVPVAALEQASRDLIRRNDPLALAAILRGYPARTVTDDQLKAVRVPLLAIVGSADPNVRGVQALKSLLPDLQVVVIDGATHVGPPRGAPARPEFVAAVRAFIAAHPMQTSQ